MASTLNPAPFAVSVAACKAVPLSTTSCRATGWTWTAPGRPWPTATASSTRPRCNPPPTAQHRARRRPGDARTLGTYPGRGYRDPAQGPPYAWAAVGNLGISGPRRATPGLCLPVRPGDRAQAVLATDLDRGRGWQWKAPPAPRPLYGLARLAARSEAAVLVAEGEKAADAAALFLPDCVTTHHDERRPSPGEVGLRTLGRAARSGLAGRGRPRRGPMRRRWRSWPGRLARCPSRFWTWSPGRGRGDRRAAGNPQGMGRGGRLGGRLDGGAAGGGCELGNARGVAAGLQQNLYGRRLAP